jgi:SAM-dependent methyltransferase
MTDRTAAVPAARNDASHAAWNEEMVRRYDIEAYYSAAHPIVRWIEAGRLRAIDRLAQVAPGARLLEVGCGAGHVLARFDARPRVGIDLSPTMLAKSRARLGPGTPLVLGSADALPFADGSFDCVICTEVLEHTPDPGAVIHELVRVAGHGCVVVSIPNESGIDRAKRALRATPGLRGMLRSLAAEGNEWHLHRFDLRMLQTVIGVTARLERVVAVPLRLLPLRYVALLRRPTGQPGREAPSEPQEVRR